MFSKINYKWVFTSLLLGLAIVSCKKDNDTETKEAAISEEEAVEAMTVAVVPDQNGLVMQFEQTALVFADTVMTDCGVLYDTVFAQSLQQNSRSYNYTLSLNWIKNCLFNGSAIDFEMNYQLAGETSSPRISSADTTNVNLRVGGLSFSADYLFTGNYNRSGSQVSKVGRQSSFSSNLNITVDSVQVDKLTQSISGGSLDLNLTGTSTKGEDFSYGGELTFNGNSNATLILDNGNTYPISW